MQTPWDAGDASHFRITVHSYRVEEPCSQERVETPVEQSLNLIPFSVNLMKDNTLLHCAKRRLT